MKSTTYRKLNDIFLDAGMFGCVFAAVLCLLELVGAALLGSDIDILDIGLNAWNAIFYLIVGNYFNKAKKGNAGLAINAVLILTICNFILPIIINLFYGILDSGLIGAISGLIANFIGTIFGVLFAIFLILELREHKKRKITCLIVFGSLMFAVTLVLFIFNMINISAVISSGIAVDAKSIVFYIVIPLVAYLSEFLFAFIYFYTPFYLKYLLR